MKPFRERTYLGQARALRKLAQGAVGCYGLGGARLKLIQHGENTTFRVDASGSTPTQVEKGPYVEDRYLLRIHRVGYQTAESIVSELAWLSALRRDFGLAVPEPVSSLDGELLVTVSVPAIPEGRSCSLLRWLEGRFCRRRCHPRHFEAVGRLMARLHQHAAHWPLPAGFSRRHWNREGLFGENAGYYLGSDEVWALLPPACRKPFEEVADQLQQVMFELGTGPDVYGLIHADLHMDNVLLRDGEARAIDFDDSGFGYWTYDFAAALCDWQGAEEWPCYRDALLGGYAQIRPLPEAQLAHLDLFMAARHVSVVLWAIDLAQVNARFRGGAGQWLEWAVGQVKGFLDGQG